MGTDDGVRIYENIDLYTAWNYCGDVQCEGAVYNLACKEKNESDEQGITIHSGARVRLPGMRRGGPTIHKNEDTAAWDRSRMRAISALAVGWGIDDDRRREPNEPKDRETVHP